CFHHPLHLRVIKKFQIALRSSQYPIARFRGSVRHFLAHTGNEPIEPLVPSHPFPKKFEWRRHVSPVSFKYFCVEPIAFANQFPNRDKIASAFEVLSGQYVKNERFYESTCSPREKCVLILFDDKNRSSNAAGLHDGRRQIRINRVQRIKPTF